MLTNNSEFCRVITENSPANIKDNERGKVNPRHLGRIQRIHSFCEKYNLSRRIPYDSEDPIRLLIEAVQTLAIKNEFRRVGENKDEISYNKYSISLNDEIIFCGYFTEEEANDITHVDPRLKVG